MIWRTCKTIGWDVVTNRPKAAAYRAPGAPMAAFAVESAVDELARGFGLDPLEVRLMNGADEGTRASYGPTYPAIGLKATLEAARRIRTGPRPWARIRGGASPAASGSISAAIPA